MEIGDTPSPATIKASIIGFCLNKKYIIETPLANGAFGEIYTGHHIKTQEKVAIKTETPKYSDELTTIKHEAKIIQFLYSKRVRKITEIYWYGMIDNAVFMIMPLYDRTLKECIPRILAKSPEEKARTIGGIIMQVLDILRNIHDNYVVHRDIKPQNFMLRGNDIYMIDFGLATFFLDDNGNHYPDTFSNTITGSPKYASIHSHRGVRYSRRDDIIALCYMAIYLENGNAVWEKEKEIENMVESPFIAAEINQYRMLKKSHIEDFTMIGSLKQFLYDNMQIGFYERPIYDWSMC
jgi:casein kinase 1